MRVVVRSLATTDAEACDAIVGSLPYHFADEQGRHDCAAAVRSQRGLVATDNSDVVGFLTWEPRFDDCAEVTWMAVHADRRREGVGGMLLDRLAADTSAAGRHFLILLTVSPSDGPDEIPRRLPSDPCFLRSERLRPRTRSRRLLGVGHTCPHGPRAQRGSGVEEQPWTSTRFSRLGRLRRR